MNNRNARVGMRPARMKIRSAVLMMHGADAWSSELEDISATGVLVRRPEEFTGKAGDMFVLDMMIGDELNIHLEATVARVTADAALLERHVHGVSDLGRGQPFDSRDRSAGLG